MPLDNSKLKTLYSALKKSGYSKDYNTFATGFGGTQNYANRKSVYDYLKSHGANIGDTYEEFMSRMYHKPTAAEVQNRKNTTERKFNSVVGIGNITNKENLRHIVTSGNKMPQDVDVSKSNYVEKPSYKKPKNRRVSTFTTIENGVPRNVYVTDSGTSYEEASQADKEQNEIYDVYAEKEREMAQSLKEAYKEKQDLNKRLLARQNAIDSEQRASMAGVPSSASFFTESRYDRDPEAARLQEAINQTDKRITALENAKKLGKEHPWQAFFKGAWDGVTDADNWSVLSGASLLRSITAHSKNGGNKGKDDLIKAEARNNEAQQYAQEKLSNSYNWGNIAGTSIPFVADFMVTNVSGIGRGIMAGTNAMARKTIVKAGLGDVKRMGVKGIAKSFANKEFKDVGKSLEATTIRDLGITSGELATSFGMTTTIQSGKTLKDIGKRNRGEAVYNPTTNKYEYVGGKSLGRSIFEGVASSTIENYTEMLGEHLPLTRLANQAFHGTLNKLGLSGVSSFFTNLSNKNFIKGANAFMKQGGMQGYANEVAEEEIAIPLHAIFDGDNQWSDLLDKKQQTDIWAGMLFSIALSGSGAMALHGTKLGVQSALYYKDKHQLNKLGEVASFRLTDSVWQPIKQRLDNATNNNLSEEISNVLSSKSLGSEEKKAVADYAQKLISMRGHNMASMKLVGQDPTSKAYAKGYTAEEEEKNKIKNNYLSAQEDMRSIFGDTRQSSDKDLLELATRYAESDNEEKKKNGLVILDFLNAKSAYDGMIARAKDDVDDAVEDVKRQVSETTNGNGQIQSGTLKQDNKRVHVVSGDIVTNEDDGSIDVHNSSNTIVVRDEETGKLEMISPNELQSVDAPIDAAPIMAQREQEVREAVAKKYADQIDGTLGFNVGDEYNTIDDNGQSDKVKIVEDKGNSVVVTSSQSGETIELAKDDVQRMSQNFVRHQIGKEKAQEEQNGNVPTLQYDDTITLTDEDGNAYSGTISDVTNDGVMVVSDNGAEMLKPEDIAQRMTSVERNGENIWNKENEEGLPTEEDNTLPTQENEEQSAIETNNDETIPTEASNEENTSQTENINEIQEEDSNQSTLARIPKDNDGNPIYEQTDADTAWDAIMEQTEGDEDMAQSVADSMVADKEKALHDVEKEKIAQSGSVADKIAAAKEHKKAVENAKDELEHWKEIASVRERRMQEEQPKEQVEDTQEQAIGDNDVRNEQEDKSATQSEDNAPIVEDEGSNVATQGDNDIVLQNDEGNVGTTRESENESGASASQTEANAAPQTNNTNIPTDGEVKQDGGTTISQTNNASQSANGLAQNEVENNNNDEKSGDTSTDVKEKFNSFVGQLATTEGEERMHVLEQMRDIITQYAEENGYPVPEYWLTTEDYLNHASPKDRAKLEDGLANGYYNPGTYRLADKKVYIYVEGCNDFDRCVRMTLAHEYTHADNDEVQDGIDTIVEAVKRRDVTLDELLDILWDLSKDNFYEEEYDRLEAKGKDNGLKMLADEVIAHIVSRMVVNGKQTLNEITQNPTISRVVTISYNRREDARRFNILQSKTPERGGSVVSRTERDNANQSSTTEGKPQNGRHGRIDNGEESLGSSEANEDGEIAKSTKKPKSGKGKSAKTKKGKEKNSGQLGLVSDERMEELKRRLRSKLNGQLNVGIDPEILAIAAELATGYIDRGLKKFSDFAKTMLDDIGDVARPYIKMSYNAARDYFEDRNIPLYKEMTPYDEVKRFDVANFDKEHTDTIEQAKQVAKEQKVEEETKKIKDKKKTKQHEAKQDNQGNPLNADGTLKLEKIASVDELTDEDFSAPTRNVELPKLPKNVDDAIGANGKPVIIKKNIFEKNWEAHKFPFAESRSILKSALYNTDLVGQTQPTKRPLHWVAIKLDEKSPIVVLEVNENKDNVEMVGWYTLDGRNLERIKRQAEKNGGEFVMLSSNKVESLSTPQNNLSSKGEDTKKSENEQPNVDTKQIDEAIAKAEKEGNTEGLNKLKAEKAFCEKHIPEKGDKKVGYKKQEDTLNITSIVNGNTQGPCFRGIHYENGFAIATDGHTMVITRQEYPTEYEGKTIGKYGRVIDLTFPKWTSVIPMQNGDEYNRSEFEDVLKDASKRYKKFKGKYKKEHPDAKAIDIAEVMTEYEKHHQILLDKNRGIDAIDTKTLLNILEWSGKDARVFYFKNRFGDYVIIKSKGVYALMLVNKVWDDIQEPDTRLIGKAKPIVEEATETKQPTLSEKRKKETKASNTTDKKETAQDKIDDVGEKIDGARKDALKKLAESMDKTTEEALVAMPFSKAFKRPNLKKAVEDGALREEDALFAQAVMSAYLSRKKPLLSKSRSSYERARSEKVIKDWAHHAYSGIEKLKKLFSLSPEERDAFMREEMDRPTYDPKEIEKRKQDLMEWNTGKVFNGTCYPINSIKLWNDVYTQLGYEVGTDVPQLFSDVVPTTGFDSYKLVAANGSLFYDATRPLNTYNAVVDEIVYQTKVANADADTDHPKEAFRVVGSGEPKTKSSGKWSVVTQASLSAKPNRSIFNSKEEAEEFAKAYMKNDGKKVDKYRYASAPKEEKEFDGYNKYAVVLRRRNVGKGTITDFELKHYDTAEEARAAIDAEHDELNELANKELAKAKEGKSASTKKPICSIEVYTEDGKKWRYGIVLSDKYAPKKSAFNTMPYYLAKDFETRKDAQAYLDAHREEIEAKAAEVDEARRNFKYFVGNGKRVGKDYRNGEDVTAEQFREQFGFRGVQFGNWTNQRDRQEAVNQAFDAFMDLSRILGVSPKALSLGGELGIAFGARGGGKASAHYEPSHVVINLTKTKGVGALAHEWWHALDNYFARQGNVAMGYVTASKSIEMRDELRQAFNTLIGHLEKSSYNERSKQRGASYWGTPIEETARMFEQWVNGQLSQRGEKSPFLTDADPYIEERYARNNYDMYKFFLGENAMPYEEYKQTPQALDGLVYLTRDELQTFGKDLKHIFDTIQQKVDKETGNTLMYHKGDVVFPLTHVETTLRDVVIEHLRKHGFNVITDVRTGQRVLELAKEEDEVRYEAARHKSKEAEERDRLLRYVDIATAMVTGKTEKEARAERRERERKFKEETKELYDRVLSGNFDDVTLRLIDDYINKSTPLNPYGRPISKRLPARALSKMRGGERTGKVDALFSRISESAVRPNERTRPEAKRRIEEKKKELLKGWAIATGNWHTSVNDFTNATEPLGKGKDSDVYASKDGDYVIKVSKGKDNLKRFRPDMDNVALFNYVFPGSKYDIVGYGEIDGKFVRFLRQPIVDFTDSTPLSVKERVAYMEHLGFKPMNDEKTAFTNGQIVASDIQGNNIVKDKQGNIRVIDADMRLHTKDVGGDYTYPPIEKDTELRPIIREHRVYHGSGADVRFFRTADGEAYGFTIGGDIYIDPRIARSDTAVHEYAHLWASALRAENKKEWKNVVDLMKGTSVWEEIKETYPELKTDDEIADEVIATYSGRRGAERLRKEMDKAMADGTASEKEAAVSALERVKQAIEKFWHAVADFLHIHYTSAEQVADQVMKDLLDGVDPREFGKEDKGKARYQFIGEQGAERADHAEEVTTRLDNLSVAREMEAAKKDAKTIKLATGWERGADGKWRYEIPDLKYYAKGDAGYKKARAQQPWSMELDALSDRIFEGEELSAEEQKRFDELAKKEKDFKTAYLNREKPHLADWVEDDELFKAYPDLKTMSVLFTDQLPRNVLGSYNEIENLIEINSALDNDVASVMAHEIQHAIQSIEGFARGGNDAYIDKVKDYIGNTSFKEMENFANNIAKLRGLPTYRDWMDNLDDNSFHQLAELKNKYQKQKNKYHPFFYAYADMVGFNEQDKNTIKAEFDKTEDEIKKILKKIGGNVQRNSFDIYKSLGGEVEARNVEKRMGMTPEERRASLAADTEDVSREDQIFLLGEDGNAESEQRGEEEYDTLRGDEALSALDGILESDDVESMPETIPTIERFREIFRHPIRSFLGELVKVKDEVFNKLNRNNRQNISGAVLPTIENADFAIRDTDGSTLYVKRFRSGNSGNVYNVVAVNKYGEVEDYVSSVHIKRDGTLRNKIKEGAELSLPHTRNTDGILSRNNSTPTAKVENNSEMYNISNEKEAPRQSTERITLPTSVQKQVEAMHLGGEVEIVADGSGFKGKKRKAKGFYNKQTGKITIILGSHTSVEDVMQTLMHEAVAHKGLRKLFGKDFNAFLDKVYAGAEKPIREKIVALAAKHGWNLRTATEEYLASLAEDEKTFEKHGGFWEKVRNFFHDMAHKLFPNLVKISDNELRYELWRSYENLKRDSSVIAEAKDIAMQSKLKVGEFAEEQGRTFDEEENLYREERQRVEVKHDYDMALEGLAHKMNFAWSDSMSGLKILQDTIAKAGNTKVEDWENAYMAENRMSSINMAEMEAYKKTFYKDLVEAVNALAKGGVKYKDVIRYMYAKHGLERNKYMQDEKIEKLYQAFSDKYGEPPIRRPNDFTSGIDRNDYASDEEYYKACKAAVDVAQNNYDEHVKKLEKQVKKISSSDYSGLSSLFDEKDFTQEARNYVDKFEKGREKAVDNLWDKVNKATHASLEKRYKSGLMSSDTYHKILDMFEYYIPLKGFEAKTSDEVYNYMGADRAYSSRTFVQPMKGRLSVADDPIANIGHDAELSIVQGNRNKMKQHFLYFALNHPSDLVSVSDLYLKYDPITDEWKSVFCDTIEDGDSAEVVAQKVEAFNERMEALCDQKPDEYKRSKDAKAIPYRVVTNHNLNEHQVYVKVLGKDYVLTINGNPEAAQALNGLTNPEINQAPQAKIIRWLNNGLSQLYTAKNAVFTATNFSRDAIFANTMVWAKESKGYAIKFHINFAKATIMMGRLMYLGSKFKLDDKNEMQRYYKEFVANGGKTGYTFMHTINDYKNEIAKMLVQSHRGYLNPLEWARGLNTLVCLMTEGSENISRFSAYMTSRQMGRSIERSIWDAKEITVNFNKKGAGHRAAGKFEKGNRLNYLQAGLSSTARGGFVFWNAGIQALSNISRTFIKNKAKTLAAFAGYFAMGAILPAMIGGALAAGGGDDDYFNLPEFVRRNNICIKTARGWIVIPLPIELRAFYGLGELAYCAMSGREKYTKEELAIKILQQMTQVLPIDPLEGGGGFNVFIPSVLKPLTEVAFNVDWTGKPIYKEDKYNQGIPEWQKVYKGTSPTLIALAQFTSEHTKRHDYDAAGWADFNPAKVQHILEGYLGGVYKVGSQLLTIFEQVIGDKDVDIRNVPFGSSFFKTADDRTKYSAIQRKYFDYMNEAERNYHTLKEHEEKAKDGDILEEARYYDMLNSEDGARIEIYKEYKNDIKEIRDKMKEENPDTPEYEELNKELMDKYSEVVQMMDATRN